MIQREHHKISSKKGLDRVRSLAEGTAHHLGTPLSVVLGRAEMIHSGEVIGQEVKLSAEIIQSKAEEMRKIIDALLDFGRRPELRRTLISVHALLHNVSDFLSTRAKSAAIDIVHQVDGDEAIKVKLDPVRMQQALYNIVLNGIDAIVENGGGKLRLRAQIEEQDHQLQSVAISVHDDGVGIPSENLQQIFCPFFTTKPIGTSLGLGLTIAEAIVVDHGGWIQVESESGKGSKFTMHLPGETPG